MLSRTHRQKYIQIPNIITRGSAGQNLPQRIDFVIKTYTIAGKAVNAETIADFEPNIALSGYTPLGIVGTRLNCLRKRNFSICRSR